MASTKQEIIRDIQSYFHGDVYSRCYVGITSDVDERLFGAHNVSKTGDRWIYRTAATHTVARQVEEYFLGAGMDGGGGGGGGGVASRIVYAYKKTPSTDP